MALGQLRHQAEAPPGGRVVEVARWLQGRSVLARFWARDVTGPSRGDFGYAQVVGGSVERIGGKRNGQQVSRKVGWPPQ